ncbi:MAG TPA: hypothetical protein GXX55_01195 [Firmicutes bacterium]|nr:hypothetical protein [Bacillota bacterium]
MERRDLTRVYVCPSCQSHTPHTVRAQNGNVYAIVCNQCRMGSLVKGEALRQHHVQWEEELRQILDSLHDWPRQGGGGDGKSPP